MKQKTITTDKATLLVVELLPKIKTETIKVVEGMMYYHDHIGIDGIAVPEGSWQLLGRLPDIKEEQWGEIVEDASYKYPYEFTRKYENYNEGDFDFNCSSESAFSLLQVNDIWFENYLGDEPKKHTVLNRDVVTTIEWDRWQEAQSKVWNKERCYLFIKVD